MTDYQITPRVLEILASRICHDLISPVSAVNNGVEFWEEMGAEAGEDAIGLIAHSAAQASTRLQLFRFAYAAGGSEQHVSLDDVKTVFEKYIEGTRAKLEWNLDNPSLDGNLEKGFCKIILHTLMIGLDVMPKGGTLSISTDENAATSHIDIQVTTESLSTNIDYIDALEGRATEEHITPKTVHPYVTRALCSIFGIKLSITTNEQGLLLSLNT